MINTETEKKLSREIVHVLRETNARNHVKIPGNLKFKDFLNNNMLLVFAIEHGVPFSIFELIQKSSPFSLIEWSGFLNISYKSLQRYKANQSDFKSPQSEKIFELAEIINKGLEVFGDIEKLKHWLYTENYSLGNLRPVDLLKDSYGKELVISELVRIDHGILV